MRQWKGIESNTAATVSDVGGDAGCSDANNISFYLDGAIDRRAGMLLATEQSGQVMTHFRTTLTGEFVIFATSSGTIVTVSI